jgi:hypothetical protein
MDGGALDKLKATRRGGGRPGRASLGAPAPSATPDQPVGQQIQRSMPYLFDPAEMPIVVEASGYLPPADFDEFYVVAAVDGNRNVVPDGCRTPVSVRMWATGQHVRRDVYAAYLKELGGEAYEQWLAAQRPVETVDLPPSDESSGG